MSLVAYADSSDGESNHSEAEDVNVNKSSHISDEEEYMLKDNHPQTHSSLNLPLPKELHKFDSIPRLLGKLPAPKEQHSTTEPALEEDDEFLHKKATPLETPVAKPSNTKHCVRITIPSLKDFDDIEEKKERKPNVKPNTQSGLMNILPAPKSSHFFKSRSNDRSTVASVDVVKPLLIPDTVKNKRPAQYTENVERPSRTTLKPKLEERIVDASDSGESDADDFFSFKNEEKLPKVKPEEIALMVSQKAAQMAEASKRFLAEITPVEEESEDLPSTEAVQTSKQKLDPEAMQALFGSHAKRMRLEEMQVIDISSEQVLPNKEEWLRTAIASTTSYQPTGVLTDDEPAAGTRRKHQITYLAHKAKANEAELQAMWATNRHSRRQTQSKYGF